MEWKTSSPWEQKLKDLVAELEDGHPRFRHMKWKQVFEQQQDSTPLQALQDTFTNNMPKFSLPLGEETIKWTVWLEDEAVWLRFSTLSQIANQDEAKRKEIKKVVLEALKDPSTERNNEGAVGIHGVTYLAWTSRI
jgi:hypothetical protein